jgi:ATP-binding cassette subfamily B protein
MTVASALDIEFDPRRPARTAMRIYAGQRRRLGLAAVAFAAKHSPVWIMPLLTANVIDAVVDHEPVSTIWLNGAVMGVLVLFNLPLTWAYARWLSLALRTIE